LQHPQTKIQKYNYPAKIAVNCFSTYSGVTLDGWNHSDFAGCSHLGIFLFVFGTYAATAPLLMGA
jgi:hypothetical protein